MLIPNRFALHPLRAADDRGILVALTQPHFSHYDWTNPDADRTNGYAPHAAFYARVAGNHPSVVMYATSHNATGYNEDMHPDLMDGRPAPRDSWAQKNAALALRAEAIVRALDPGRLVYHHAGGNLGAVYTSNFYPNFVPVQELSDWFEPWATQGRKPLFLCEYGAPFSWDWAMYRGWYRGKREFGSAVVPWEFCLAEWNAQFLGDQTFPSSEREQRNLRWEAEQFRRGRLWHRWDYPHQLGSTDFPERDPVFADYYAENWRAFRTWGLSGNSPWEHHLLFRLRPGLDRNRREPLPVDWDNLQRPGFSPDYLEERYERMDLAYARSDWLPTPAAEALRRNNGPLLAWLGGKSARFTSKDHIFLPGDTLEKQFILINNSRVPVEADCRWSLALPEPLHGQTHVSLEPGTQLRVPLRLELPGPLGPGEYRLTAVAHFSTGGAQEDQLTIQVLPRRPPPRLPAGLAVFDPAGDTAAWLRRSGARFSEVDATANLATCSVLVVGKAALDLTNPAPNIDRVRDGLKVVVFEQKPEVLERRFGFRIAEYGLRRVFPRVPDHPALAGLGPEHLRDWRGEATLVPPRIGTRPDPRFNGAPTVTWCGLPVTRLWRCGCQGNVASALIEKPPCGDFLPVVDGGFSLQYSPLLEYREGKGMVLFCQMDVTGRTEPDPAAAVLAANLLDYASSWEPPARCTAVYTGEAAGRTHLEAAGLRLGTPAADALDPRQLLVVGPYASQSEVPHRDRVAAFLAAGGRLLAIGLNQDRAEALLPFPIEMHTAEYIDAAFPPPRLDSPFAAFAGLGPADLHNRAPRMLPLIRGGADTPGGGVLAVAAGGQILLCQLVPWQFAYRDNDGLRRTFRRTSFVLGRLFGNLGVSTKTPLLARFSTPVDPQEPPRWESGLYLDQPGEWDDPYRFFRW